MPNIYTNTEFSKPEKPKSKKFASWDRRVQTSTSLIQQCNREINGDNGVVYRGVSWNFDRVYFYDVSASGTDKWKNYTYPVRDQEATPIVPQPWLLTNGDIIYLGFNSHFKGITHNLQTAGTAGTASYYYWNNVLYDWVSFTPTSAANINNFIASGTVTFDLEDTPDWGMITLNNIIIEGGGSDSIDNNSLYWVKIIIGAYGTYPKFYIIATNRTTIDLTVLPSYTAEGAERAVFVAPGKAMVDGILRILPSEVKLTIETSTETMPYYGAVMIDYMGDLSVLYSMTGDCFKVQVIPASTSIKLADIVLDATSGVEEIDIIDTRFLIA